MEVSNGGDLCFWDGIISNRDVLRWRMAMVWGIVVTTGIKPSSNIGNALVSAMYGRSSELGLYQTYTSVHPFDILVAGLVWGAGAPKCRVVAVVAVVAGKFSGTHSRQDTARTSRISVGWPEIWRRRDTYAPDRDICTFFVSSLLLFHWDLVCCTSPEEDFAHGESPAQCNRLERKILWERWPAR